MSKKNLFQNSHTKKPPKSNETCAISKIITFTSHTDFCKALLWQSILLALCQLSVIFNNNKTLSR